MNIIDKLKISLKENAGAIVTAVVAFVLVIYYLVIVIPNNKTELDRSNLVNIAEFNQQFTNTLNDYGNAVDTNRLRHVIAGQAERILKQNNDRLKKDPGLKVWLEDIKKYNGEILKNWARTIIIKSIKIYQIEERNDKLVIKTLNHIYFDTLSFKKKFPRIQDVELMKELCLLTDSVTISKKDIKERLNGFIHFNHWVICSRNASKGKNEAYTPLINYNLDTQEADSILQSRASLGVVTFAFSDKRFYKHYYSLAETDFQIMLAAGVNAADFENNAKKVDQSWIIICILLVLLLFLSVPLIKPVISSATEKLTQFDLVNATLSVGVLIVVIVCFALTTYLSHYQRELVDVNLKSINSVVGNDFKTELYKYTMQMNKTPELKKNSDTVVSKSNYKAEGEGLEGLQNFFLMNPAGDLVKDIYVNNNRSFRKNFGERDYFKKLTGTESLYTSAFSTVYSKNNNRFVCVLAGKTSKNYVKGLAYKPRFNQHYKPLVEFGYLICDNTGRVLLHSDERKRINEDVFLNTGSPNEMLDLFRGYVVQPFTASYNNQHCRFYGERLNYTTDSTGTESPIYLMTFKKLNFEDKLSVYTIINSFFISLAYVLIITMLVTVYSVFFYIQHVPLFSRYHIYWLFPDNSRKREYQVIAVVNGVIILLLLIPYFLRWNETWFIAMITGINVVFYNFILLSQRFFLMNRNSAKRNFWVIMLVITGLLSLQIAMMAYHRGHLWLGVAGTFFLQGLFIYFFRKLHKIAFPFETELKKVPSAKLPFTRFLASIITLHYFLVPIIVVSTLFSSEVDKTNYYNHSILNQNLINTTNQNPHQYTVNDHFFSALTWLVESPSRDVLKRAMIDKVEVAAGQYSFWESISNGVGLYKLLILLGWLSAMMVLIWALTRFYTSRFFFFDLLEIYRLGYFKNKNKFENPKSIIPPFNDEDIKTLEKYERYASDEEKALINFEYLQQIPDKIVSKEKKLEFILEENLRTYQKFYEATWNELSEGEKIVIHDFAIDHFVNYKNKAHLIRLMERGIIVTDALTGRLKVMNLGFRNFVLVHALNDKEFVNVEAEKDSGNFSKWKFPILIIAVTILLLVMYLYKQDFDHIILVGGSAISALGLITKFLDSYKNSGN